VNSAGCGSGMSSSPGQARRYRVGRCWLGITVWVIVEFGGETHDRRATTIHSATQYSAVPGQALLCIWTFFRRECQTGDKRRTPARSRVAAREPFPLPRNEQTLVLTVSKNRSPWLETPSLPDGIPDLVDPKTTGYDPKRPLWIAEGAFLTWWLKIALGTRSKLMDRYQRWNASPRSWKKPELLTVAAVGLGPSLEKTLKQSWCTSESGLRCWSVPSHD